jgi:hypothetical protein
VGAQGATRRHRRLDVAFQGASDFASIGLVTV